MVVNTLIVYKGAHYEPAYLGLAVFKFNCLSLLVLEMKTAEFANRVYLNQVAHLDLHGFPSSL